MYTSSLDRARSSIEALKRHLQTSDSLRKVIHETALACKVETRCFEPLSAAAAPDHVEWRIIDHCAAVTRVYAIYEQFAHEMIREHLSLLQRHYSFDDLDDSIKNSYRVGLSKILEKKDGPRYGDLDLSLLITQYNNALTGQPYVLEPRAMAMQDQNLRLSELHRLMAACGVDGVDGWIEKHHSVKNFFTSGEDRLAATARKELAELIQYRNDAAHGGLVVDDVLGPDVLLEFCDFTAVLCEALAEKVQLVGLEVMYQKNTAVIHGEVSELLKDGMVIIGPMQGHFQVGGRIYLCGANYCFERTIASIRIDDADYQHVSLEEEVEVGVCLDQQGRRGAKVMSIAPLL